MTKDLEETLDGMGPAYRAVVDRLVAGAEAEPRSGRRTPTFPPRSRAFGRQTLLAAASLLILLGLGFVFLRHAEQTGAARTSGAAREYCLAETPDGEAVAEMIRTQNADGSWRNDFLTRRNAAALSHSSLAGARVAYKKAMRNLRVRGLL